MLGYKIEEQAIKACPGGGGDKKEDSGCRKWGVEHFDFGRSEIHENYSLSMFGTFFKIDEEYMPGQTL